MSCCFVYALYLSPVWLRAEFLLGFFRGRRTCPARGFQDRGSVKILILAPGFGQNQQVASTLAQAAWAIMLALVGANRGGFVECGKVGAEFLDIPWNIVTTRCCNSILSILTYSCNHILCQPPPTSWFLKTCSSKASAQNRGSYTPQPDLDTTSRGGFSAHVVHRSS